MARRTPRVRVLASGVFAARPGLEIMQRGGYQGKRPAGPPEQQPKRNRNNDEDDEFDMDDMLDDEEEMLMEEMVANVGQAPDDVDVESIGRAKRPRTTGRRELPCGGWDCCPPRRVSGFCVLGSGREASLHRVRGSFYGLRLSRVARRVRFTHIQLY